MKIDDKIRVLITPLGTQTAVEIIKSLLGFKDIELYGCDTDAFNVGACWVKESFLAPSLFSSDFFPFLEKLVKKKNINIIYPTHDWFLLPFAKRKSIGTAKIIVPDEEVVRITRSKEKTYKFFKGIFSVPEVYKPEGIKKDKFPLFIKPKKGRGSEKAFKIENMKQLKGLWAAINDPILMEYLPGKEYTVDCLCNLDGKLLVTCIRERLKIIRGISAIAKVVEREEIQIMAERITEKLKLPGSWFFQVKENKEGIPTLLEINARIGGTLSLTRMAGVNIPYLAVLLFAGKKISGIPRIKTGLVTTRYLNEHYLLEGFNKIKCIIWDMDDTLWEGRLFEDKIKLNSRIVSLLLELSQRGMIQVIVSNNPYLRNKTEADIRRIFKENNLPDVFSRILINEQPKSMNIKKILLGLKLKPEEIIFIDDAYLEREKVSSQILNIWAIDSRNAQELLSLHEAI